jgi:hypothetical protein
VQLEDGAGQLTVGQRGQVGRPEFGLGLDRRGLLGREEAEERALRDLRLRGHVLQRGAAEAIRREQPQRRVGARGGSALLARSGSERSQAEVLTPGILPRSDTKKLNRLSSF